jgi:hypothetical protein
MSEILSSEIGSLLMTGDSRRRGEGDCGRAREAHSVRCSQKYFRVGDLVISDEAVCVVIGDLTIFCALGYVPVYCILRSARVLPLHYILESRFTKKHQIWR